MGPISRTVSVVALSATLLAGAVQAQAARERRYPPDPADDLLQWLYVTSAQAVQRLTRPVNALAADVYWIRAIQYYGSTMTRLARRPHELEPPPMLAAPHEDEYPLLYSLLDITTTLDPSFKIAYRFGAIFLAETYPAGPGRPDLAVDLLEKGVRADPARWEYKLDIGFVNYWYTHDYARAADWFQRASQVHDAPLWLRPLAAVTAAQGGDRRSSRLMWEAIRQSAEVDWLRDSATRRLAQLGALDAIDRLQRIVDEYARRTGSAPSDWSAVVAARLLPGTPLDPSGSAYVLSADGQVRLSDQSTLSPLPIEPASTDRPSS